MLSTLTSGLLGCGFFLLYKGLRSRKHDPYPPGVEPGTPPKQWAATATRKEIQQASFARSWKVFAGLGAVSIAAGLISMIASARTPPVPDRDQLVQAMLASPDNQYSQDELECTVGFLMDRGLNPAKGTEDDYLAEMARILANLSDAEIDEMDQCFTSESQQRHQSEPANLTDDQIRTLLIEALTSGPDPLHSEEAECFVDYLTEAGVLNEVLSADTQVSPQLETASLEAELACTKY